MKGVEGATTFEDFFSAATDHTPFRYQSALAQEDELPDIIDVPTGLGKTDAVILSWLWRRRMHPSPDVRTATPRRLVYCLPTRTLVEQKESAIHNRLKWLGLLTANPGNLTPLKNRTCFLGNTTPGVPIKVFLGGKEPMSPKGNPTPDEIPIGIQDCLRLGSFSRRCNSSNYRSFSSKKMMVSQ